MEPGVVVEVPDEPEKISSTRRYWTESNGLLCTICLEPDHQAKNCDHQLCLTCGAIDEHPTRQCPVSLVCYSCGSRGHLSRHCPSSTNWSKNSCGRCRSTFHLTLNCPSIWRCYDEEPNRKPKRVIKACYHCGNTGDHFGDECPFRRSSPRTEPSAFTSYAIPDHRDRHSTHRDRRSEKHSSPRYSSVQLNRYRPSEYPPEHRKRRDRASERARAATSHARQERVEDEDDWFSRRYHKGTPKRSNPSNDKKQSKHNRIGGSYEGGYIK